MRNPGRRDGDDARPDRTGTPAEQAGGTEVLADGGVPAARVPVDPTPAEGAGPEDPCDARVGADAAVCADGCPDDCLDGCPDGSADDLLFDPLLSDEPIDLAAVHADDALLDALGGGDPTAARALVDPDDPLIAMLAAWAACSRQDEIDPPTARPRFTVVGGERPDTGRPGTAPDTGRPDTGPAALVGPPASDPAASDPTVSDPAAPAPAASGPAASAPAASRTSTTAPAASAPPASAPAAASGAALTATGRGDDTVRLRAPGRPDAGRGSAAGSDGPRVDAAPERKGPTPAAASDPATLPGLTRHAEPDTVQIVGPARPAGPDTGVLQVPVGATRAALPDDIGTAVTVPMSKPVRGVLERAGTRLRGRRGPGASRPVHPLRRAAVAVIVAGLGISGAAATGSTAQPGDAGFTMTRVFFSERARSLEAAQVVSTGLARARDHLAHHRPDLAAQELAVVDAALPEVRDEEGHNQLAGQQRAVAAAVAVTPLDPDTAAAAKDVPPGVRRDPGGSVLAEGAAPGPGTPPPADGRPAGDATLDGGDPTDDADAADDDDASSGDDSTDDRDSDGDSTDADDSDATAGRSSSARKSADRDSAGDADTGGGKTGSSTTGSGKTSSGKTSSSAASKDKADGGTTGKDKTGGGTTGNGTTGNGTTGNGTTGNGTTGNGTTGNGTTGGGSTTSGGTSGGGTTGEAGEAAPAPGAGVGGATEQGSASVTPPAPGAGPAAAGKAAPRTKATGTVTATRRPPNPERDKPQRNARPDSAGASPSASGSAGPAKPATSAKPAAGGTGSGGSGDGGTSGRPDQGGSAADGPPTGSGAAADGKGKVVTTVPAPANGSSR
ncbi:MAG TPA: hypothetical protein VF667_13220 [Pseudonocardia sp.]